MYIANIPAGMQLWQKENHESLYTGSWFPSPTSRGPEMSERILQIPKKYDNKTKHGYHPLQHEPAFPDDKFKAAAGLSCMLSVGA